MAPSQLVQGFRSAHRISRLLTAHCLPHSIRVAAHREFPRTRRFATRTGPIPRRLVAICGLGIGFASALIYAGQKSKRGPLGTEAPSSSPEHTARAEPAYQYRPLGSNETRLLLLHPGTFEEPLRCCLENLESIRNPKAPYTAVSYSWNEVPGTASIECDSILFEITASAHNALRRLRHPTEMRRVWIDGLCINQQDLAEKEKVVKRMEDVYSYANEVVIWLGEPATENTRFMDDYASWKVSGELGTPHHFIGLLKRAWFTRKWILQEAVLAKRNGLTVLCGAHAIPWDGEHGFARFLLDSRMGLHVGEMPESDRIQQAIRTVRFIDENRKLRQPSSLFSVLLRTRYTEASNVTDYVAAVLGLAEDWDAHCGLSPVYGAPGEENSDPVKNREFIKFATWDVRQSNSTRVLAYASGPKLTPGGLPSWVPDWTIKDKPEPLSTYAAANNFLYPAREKSHVRAQLDGEQPLLEVRGEVIDTVKAVTSKAPEEFSRSRLRAAYDDSTRTEVSRWLQECLDLATDGRNKTFDRREDFTQFAKAISLRFHRMPDWATVLHFQQTSDHAELVAEYFREMTGRRPLSLPAPDWVRDIGADMWVIGHVEEPLRRWAVGRRFCRTTQGRLGFVPVDAKPGDKICLIRGHGAPYVLRRHGDRYMAVGECYMEGVMDMTPESGAHKLDEERFLLT